MPKRTASTPLRLDQQLTSGVTTITPAAAEEWLGRNESNRNLRPARVAQFVRDMKAGNFTLTGETIKFDWNGNLIDGQHRLTAVRDSGVAIQALVVHGLAPSVRAVIDTGSRRSASDALRMAGKHGASRSMAATVRLLLGIANGSVVRAGDVPPPVTHSETIEFYETNQELLDYCVVFANRHHRAISARPSALAAAMFIAGQRDLGRFTAFITAIVELKFAAAGDPARTLFKRLQSLRDEAHQSSEEVYFFLRAFDAHMAGQKVTQMKSATGPGRSRIPTWSWGSAA